MITTITTGVISTISSVTSVTGLTAAISIAAVVSLIFFLTTKELAGAGGSRTSLRIAKSVGVGILPLVMAFAIIVAVKIVEVL